MAVALVTYTHYDTVAKQVGIGAAMRLTVATTLATAIHANRTVPVETSKLRLSQRHRIRRVGLTARGTITYPLDYAASVHEGARPHVIRARNPTGNLVFYWKKRGRRVVTPKVNHPGNRTPNPWLFRALMLQAGRRDFRVMPR